MSSLLHLHRKTTFTSWVKSLHISYQLFILLLLLEAKIIFIYYYCGASEQRHKQKSSTEKTPAHSIRLHVLHVWPLKANPNRFDLKNGFSLMVSIHHSKFSVILKSHNYHNMYNVRFDNDGHLCRLNNTSYMYLKTTK